MAEDNTGVKESIDIDRTACECEYALLREDIVEWRSAVQRRRIRCMVCDHVFGTYESKHSLLVDAGHTRVSQRL